MFCLKHKLSSLNTEPATQQQVTVWPFQILTAASQVTGA